MTHARQLNEGDFTARTSGDMPGEFRILASAMNQTTESLSRIVSVVRKRRRTSLDPHASVFRHEQISGAAGEDRDGHDGMKSRQAREKQVKAASLDRQLAPVDARRRPQRARRRGAGERAGRGNPRSAVRSVSRWCGRLAISPTFAIRFRRHPGGEGAEHDGRRHQSINGSGDRIASRRTCGAQRGDRSGPCGKGGQGVRGGRDEVRKLAEQKKTAAKTSCRDGGGHAACLEHDTKR